MDGDISIGRSRRAPCPVFASHCVLLSQLRSPSVPAFCLFLLPFGLPSGRPFSCLRASHRSLVQSSLCFTVSCSFFCWYLINSSGILTSIPWYSLRCDVVRHTILCSLHLLLYNARRVPANSVGSLLSGSVGSTSILPSSTLASAARSYSLSLSLSRLLSLSLTFL